MTKIATRFALIGGLVCFSMTALAQGSKRGPASSKGLRAPAQAAPAPAATSAESNELDALLASSGSEAEAEAEAAAADPTPATAPTPTPKSDKATASSDRAARIAAARARLMMIDPWRQGWKARDFNRAFGFSTGLTGSSNAIVIENTPDAETSWGFHFGFSKSADSFTEGNTTTVTGTAATTTTTSLVRSGSKQNATFSFGATYMNRIYKNDFILVRWGGFGGLDYIGAAKYGVGSRSESSSSATPGTVSVTETNFGETTVKSTPGIKLGPVFDASLYLRWFPNISVGFIGGMLYEMDRKVTTTTSTVSRTYDIVGGVDQTPTSNTTNNSESVVNRGPVLSTYALAGQNFNLFGSFVLRYLW